MIKLKEDVPVNNVGDGNIAGLGVGPQGDPVFKKKKKSIKYIDFNLFRRTVDNSKKQC
jgi:hypothetical protein